MNLRYRTWIEIDVKKLRANVSEFLRCIPPATRLMLVVKSNAYGHGIVGIAKELVKIQKLRKRVWLGVDSVVEAARLRKEGIQSPILNLGHVLPSYLREAAKMNISITVSTFETLTELRRLKKPPSVHIKFDTGMHRQGFDPAALSQLYSALKKIPHLNVEGIYTHLADPENIPLAKKQLALFADRVRAFRVPYPKSIAHALSTGGVLYHPTAANDMIRLGMGMYGYFPSAKAVVAHSRHMKLRPILTWKSIICEVKAVGAGEGVGYDFTERLRRNSRLAIVPIGYWHGFDRSLSSRGTVLVHGKYARVLGRVSMDMITIDVTDIPRARVGDEVVIIGADGKHCITAEELAHDSDTSPYEVLTRINPLIRREYS